ncbi:hypothetical protein SOPP22_13080 [Shewanella sp. OPT22]|nr:hypothetical protein SOPP22_13080 [Shewanella sp. OPT22]
MLKQVSPLVLILAVSACSTPIERRQANGSDDYINAKSESKLVIPEGLHEPKYNREYQIPNVEKNAKSLVGEALDIRPPLQVLPTAEGTHVEDAGNGIKIVIESIDSTTNLKQEITSSIKAFLKHRDIKILKETTDPLTIQTDWIESKEVIDSSMWGSDKVYTLRQRYEFAINIKPHGRTGDITIKLIEHHEDYNGTEQNIMLTGDDEHRYAVDMLNSAIGYLSHSRDKTIKAKRIARSAGISTKFVSTPSDSQHWVAKADFQKVWDRLRIVLPEAGFEIVDVDTNKGLYYVDFKQETGFWSSLWGDSKELKLENGSYRVVAKEGSLPNTTDIRILTPDEKPLSTESMNGLSEIFVKLMQEKRS